MWQREDFFQFRPGMTVADFPADKIPIAQMEHLRQSDYQISGGISYERTVHTFLTQLELSDGLHPFKKFKNAVILIDDEGAMICENGEWDLIFTPDQLESLNLAPDEDMVPVYEKILKDLETGRKCRIHLNRYSVLSLLNDPHRFDILDNYCCNHPGGYLAVAQHIVTHGPEELFANVPVCHYGKLVAVDIEERESYVSIKEMMEEYIYAADHSAGRNLRPLSVAVFGTPGSGKSFGVKQIANSFGSFETYTLNLSQYNSYEDMLRALDNVLKANRDDVIPLVFFDEFDCELGGVSRGWLKYLLAPMQDGEYTVNGKLETIGKAVFVFAGGTASSFNGFLPSDEEEKRAFALSKGPDFVSRLRGILNIKGPNPVSVTDRSYIIRRAMLLRDMIRWKFPQIFDEKTGTINISVSLLSALLRTTEYRHGARSMEFVLDMSRLAKAEKYTPSCLPLSHQLNIHLDYSDLAKKLAVGRFGDEAFEKYAKNAYEVFRMRISSEMEKNNPAFEMKAWDDLGEEKKEECCMNLRMQAEEMEDIRFPVGLRPQSKGMADTIRELYGDTLELMARLENDTWVRMKMEKGWKYGEKESEGDRVSPRICLYDDLPRAEQEKRLGRAVHIPEYFSLIGLEMYRKTF